MPLLVNSVPNLAQGVSQQPDNLRYPGQCDEQINAWATVVEGLVKRPPTNYTKNIYATDPGADLFTHFVKRDEDNKYCVTVSLGSGTPSLGVINLETGTSIPVTTTSIAQSYLSGITNPLADLRALTVADYTFLVNKKKEVKVDKNFKSNDLEYEGLIVVKLGDYEKNYDIYLDGNLIRPDSLNTNNPAYPGGVQSDQIPKAGHTYESGDAQGNLKGEYADTGVIAEDLEIILKDHLASQDGLGTVTFSNPPGVLDLGFPDSGLTWGSGLGWTTTGTADWLGVIEYEFKIDQYSTNILSQQDENTLIATGVKGTMTFNDGVVKSWKLTHEGLGYNTNLASDYYKLTIIYNRKDAWHWDGRWNKVLHIDASNASSYGFTMPDFTFSTRSLNFQVDRKGAVIKITGDADFSLRTEDGLANEGLGVAYKEVQSITDLPKHCFDGFRIKVIGDADIDQDDYYVQFSTKDKENFGEGSWIEIAGWEKNNLSAGLALGIETNIDNTTVPITLVPRFNSSGDVTNFILQTPNELINYVEHNGVVYSLAKEHVSDNNNEPGSSVDADGDGIEDWKQYWVVSSDYTIVNKYWSSGTSYSFKMVGYTARGAGDNSTNPFPSFVGSTINDVFFFKNRLGFLTDSNVIFSEADEYFNFFRTTTQQLLDSAPIDVGLSHTKVAVLQHAVPFQEKLMLFSKQSQFVLRGAEVLSPKTVAIAPVTEYDISDSVQPIALGNYIYFTFKRNEYEGVYEYFVDNNTETFNSEEITQQIPKYITSDVQRIAGSQAENTIVIGTSADAKTLFIYKYFWSNKEKIQSAWMKFTFGRDIRGFDFIDSNLHLITADTDGLHLEQLTLEDGIKDTGLDYTLYLDSRVDGSTLTTSYDAAAKTTTISGFPYDPVDVEIYTKTGHKVAFTRTSATAGTVGTDLTSTDFFAGVPYNMLYRFSDQTLKQPTERGGRSASDYAFQTIRNGSINYADTGHFTVEVTPKYRDKYTYAFNPDIVGANLTLNTFTPQNGHFRFPVQAQPNEATIEVVSDSALPVKLLGAEFESMFIPRSRRYGA